MIRPLSHALTQTQAGKTSGRKAPVGANFFGTQLTSALTGPPATAAKPATAATPAAASTANSASLSQNPVTNTLFSLAAVPTPATVAPDTQPQSAPVTSTQAAMGVLAKALQAAGISPQWLNMSAHDDYVSYPGGPGYTNHLISLTANGHDTNIDANLMMINPNVAVTEIKRLFTIV